MLIINILQIFTPRAYILDKPNMKRNSDRMKANNALIEAEEINLKTLATEYANERKARKLLEAMLWPNGPVCPHCKNHTDKPIYKIKPAKESKSPARDGVYKCGACRKQFTVTVKTIFEKSHIPLGTWLMAIFIICASKKSVSSKQLERMLGVTYKTAWFLSHRIRYAMTPIHWAVPKLTGDVEVDETFVKTSTDERTIHEGHTPVVALVQRDGPARVKVIASVTQKNLGQALYECVDKSAEIHTDEHLGYRQPAKQYKAHHAVNHSKYEYHRTNPDGTICTTNSAESFFSLLKRGVYGAWHHVSPEHLPKYANEFAFRWTHRKVTDGERMGEFMPLSVGKRMMYRRPKTGVNYFLTGHRLLG
jgi:transposase-like protein